MKPALSVRNIYKIFGDHPKRALSMLEEGHDKDHIFEETGLTVGVRDASFDIQEGEIFVIMGLSGSGKSTMVRMLNRLIKPTAGHIMLGDTDIAELPEKALLDVRRRKVSMVFQSFALMPHMNVLDNVAFGRELAGESAPQRRERAQKALDRVGLGQHAGSYPDELSGGMQQRVGLARALCTDPDVLLMDEAFSALDPLIRTEMQDELLRLQEEDRRTVVFISHDLDEAFRIGDRIAIMEGGAIVQIGTPDEILHNPANDYVRAFFRGVDVCNVFTAGDIARKAQVTIVRKRGEDGTGPRAALKMLQDYERDYGYVLDVDHRFLGVVSAQSLKQAVDRGGKLQDALLDAPKPVPDDTPVAEIITEVAQAECGVPVVDADGIYRGVISKTTLLETMDRDTEAEPRQTEADQA